MNYRFMAYEALVHLREALNGFPNQDLIQETNQLLEQIQNRRYIVAVAGDFKRGKSSLINALLGMPILPMDINPMTAAMNRIVYGLTPSVEVLNKDGTNFNIKVDELVDYVTKQTEESLERARNIREAIIRYPLILCQNGVEILDTPGLNDTDEMADVTNEALQHVHAVIFAVSAVMPLSMTEAEWIVKAIGMENLQYLMFAVTFFDRVAEKDQEKVLSNIKSRIASMVFEEAEKRYVHQPIIMEKVKRLTDVESIFIMPVASRDALEAFNTGDDELLQKSSLPEFKKQLMTVLNAQQDVYVIRQTNALIYKIRNWMTQAYQSQETNLNDFQRQYEACDRAVYFLRMYPQMVRDRTRILLEEIADDIVEDQPAFPCMQEAVNAVILKKRSEIQSNDDVHRILMESTHEAEAAAKSYYLEMWSRYLNMTNQYIEDVSQVHEKLLAVCSGTMQTARSFSCTCDTSSIYWLVMLRYRLHISK